ncbi:GGDEF domain-containing protein [Thalassotalea sp. M1531]|uniref:diguanylate cyclase n=1 Tax=Thalassotalea algicola TaxID=2716224 RepID=A0A7Y0LF78_9GAMM|nr:GGDEF domain-containing protein [Thalassotalea algicola]NMP33218.1 GGDEF domain-containing protein [Thalassotalea algicola]
MANHFFSKLIIVGIISFFVFPIYANTDYDAKLKALDSIRSSDNKKFIEQLAEFEATEKSLSPYQQQHLKYLQAYKATFSGNLEEAVKLSKELTGPETNEEFRFRSSLLLLNTLAVSKNWQEGMAYLTLIIDSLPNLTSVELRDTGIAVILQTYVLYGQYDEVINFNRNSLSANPSPRNNCLVNWFTLDAKIQSGNIKVNSPEFDKVESLCSLANEPLVTNIVRLREAQLYLTKEDTDQALMILLMAQDDVVKANYRRLITEVHATFANAYLAKENLERAKEFANKVIENISGLETTEPARIAYEVLYKLAKSQQDHENALAYYEKYTSTDRAYLDEIEAKALAFQKAKQNSILQKSEINLLNKQNELLNSRNELLKAEQSLAQSEAENTRLVAALLMAIVTLLTFFGYRSWRTQRRLKTLAEYDYLTKVYNRGHFMTIAEDTLALAQKAKQNVTCIIFDLDKFKSVNDTYGHSAGDWALKATVAAVKDCIRENDIFARLGGEEFIILLPSCDIQAATYVAEKCIHKLQKIDTTESGHDFTITASFGITTSKISGYNISALSTDADAALYKSKDNGRNQLTIFEK